MAAIQIGDEDGATMGQTHYSQTTINYRRQRRPRRRRRCCCPAHHLDVSPQFSQHFMQ